MNDMDIQVYLNRYLHLLNDTPLFCDMQECELDKALELMCAKFSSYGKDEFLHFPYEPLDSFGLVLSGVVQVCIDDIQGNRIIMAEVLPGVTFGESLCYLHINDSPVYAYSSKPADVLWLSTEELFGDLCDPFVVKLQKRFISMLASRTLSMNNRIQILSKIRLREKITTYFTLMSQQTKSLSFQIPMSRDDFAIYIGTNRSALSRELSNMKKEGLIDFDKNHIKILK